MYKIGMTKEQYEGSYQFRGDKIFRILKNGETNTALENGQVVFYDGADGETVKKCATANLTRMAGIVCNADNLEDADYKIEAGKYGTVQIAGLSYALANNDIDAVGKSAKGVDAQKYLTVDQAAGTAPSFYNYCIALEANNTYSVPVLTQVSVHCM